MFILSDFTERYGLNEIISREKWHGPPLKVRVIEFLDEQSALMPDVVYISDVQNAESYFSGCKPEVINDAFLIIANADDNIMNVDWLPEQLTFVAFKNKLGKVYNCANEYISLPTKPEYSKKFGDIWNMIMCSDHISSADIWKELKELPDIVQPFVQIAVVRFASKSENTPYNLITKKLMAVFKNCCTTVKDKEIVILLTYKVRTFEFQYDLDTVQSILEQYNGCMAISNGTRDLSALRALYYMTKRAISLSTDIGIAKNDRVLTFDRVGTYVIIDLCAQGFRAATKNEDVLYMAHPAIVAIARYDKKHNDNLREILYFYLSYNNRVSDVADVLHMHRNTVMNKIKKTVQLFDLDLENRHLRQQLLFSLQIYKYNEIINGGGD